MNRLPIEMGRLMAARVVGASRSEEMYLQAGDLLANQLAACGLNMDFAPVADLDDGPPGTAIGDRSFGADAAAAATAASQVMVGIRMNNIIPVVKHFPGHGNTRIDSHVQLPVVKKSQAQLEATDLLPFAAAIECGAHAIMVGHVLVPELDTENPASLSWAITTGLLRDEMGFEGVIMTDDLAMRPIRDKHRIGDAAVAAVLAGADVVMISAGLPEQVEAALALQNAVLSGVIPLTRIDESVRRIVELKEAFYLDDSNPEPQDIAALRERVTEFAAKVRHWVDAPR